jgi:thiol-disulfide isomerase/thioredoxin
VDAARALAASAACPATAKDANLDFTLKDMDGRDLRLADYKGKVILLDFWATWCGPCKYEIPGFVELQEQYGKQGLQVIGVSVDDTADKLPPFVKQFKMNYPVLLGLGRDDVQDAYGPIWGIPVNVLISRAGKICARHTGLPPAESGNVSLQQAVKDAFEAEIPLNLSSSQSASGSPLVRRNLPAAALRSCRETRNHENHSQRRFVVSAFGARWATRQTGVGCSRCGAAG